MKIKISTKLFTGLGILLFMLIAMSSGIYWSIEKLERIKAEVIELSDLNTFFSERTTDHLKWMDYLTSGVFIQGKEFKGKINPDECELGKWIKTFNPYSEEIAIPFRELDEPHRRFHASADRILSYWNEGKRDRAHEVFISETVRNVKAVQENLYKMKEILKKDISIKNNELKDGIKKTKIILFGLALTILLGIIGGIIFVRRISNGITVPIQKMLIAMKRTAEGDLTCEVAVRGSNEVVQMAEEFNKVVKGLKALIINAVMMTNRVSSVTERMALSSSKVSTAANMQHDTIEKTAGFVREIDNSISSVAVNAESLSLSSEETSSAALEMATSIERVAENADIFSTSASDAASSVEEMIASVKEISDSLELLSASFDETSSSLTEMSTTVREIEDNAVESVRLAEHVTVEASDKGMNAADAAIKGIEEIKASVGSLADAINRLGKRSEEIGEILTVIAEVADQTSLLALNAAILAAQAGEHGKGFAVVADEIKGLAGKTAISTKEIASLIESVQTETRLSVEMVQEGIQSVDKGMKLVREVNVTLRSIVESAGTSTEKAKFIQRATTEETQVIEHVTKAIKHMSEQIDHISRATKEQSKGGRLVIDAVEKIKEISRQVKNATAEQSGGSRQISKASGNVSHQAEQIAAATAQQREKSQEIVSSIESIKKIAAGSVNITNEMNTAVKSMEEEAKSLLLELQKFKV